MLAALVALLVWYCAVALRSKGLATGFDYLSTEAGFGIGESLIPFTPSDTFLRAFFVALLNTLVISIVAIPAATVIGFATGLMRLSPHWLPRSFSRCYVELFRNTPQLLQIIFWYSVARNFPGPRQAIEPVPGIFLSNRGVQIPWFSPTAPWLPLVIAMVIAATISISWTALVNRRQKQTGRRLPVLAPVILLMVVLPALTWMALGQPNVISFSSLQGFNFRGGLSLTPEFLALFLGLSLYIGAFVSEIVRGALQGLDKGQGEAARSLGLRPGLVYRLVLIPQAVRVMLPPLAAQYISLIKNSSLAVAIGYPDIVNISKTTINQTGKVVEAIILMSAVYLVISLAIAAAMQMYERVLQRRISR
ncbi:ABC transporter permease subunit [Agrobacterium tumefaciens]|uniref:ABC transporter permease subunit n=1 Tax=Agrobacterium tumefaciens TaxID=358 RepID=UPI001574CF44|nr:ABC transporter permease subunit [Agrobacterium tumefaciens]NSZ36393.1 ABC transporter permease subunit [Agrobacterium tumefaciens]NTB21909.1 ABC transporter permease subunit [Agrobacterium tumefaciens]NTB31745.1 ABC transporter permease subunit [Agrobacterium tumefaciens]NTB32226.1 ABC transporter permease subunit [Agrobacterium tumefaciens]